jgi:hypothetical protein
LCDQVSLGVSADLSTVTPTVTHQHGEVAHLAYLERPFHEACAALHRRMHELGISH